MMDEFASLVGKTLIRIDGKPGDEVMTLYTADETFRMLHYQDCCEHVSIDDVAGDLVDLIGSPILLAEEASQTCPDSSESGTWTFYKLATAKGHVTIRWLGESNGYYSERADFVKVTE
jgi:hypothetical protein